MTAFFDPVSFVADRQGVPLARAQYRFYAGSSSVPLVVYADAARTSPHPDAVTTDFAGRRPVVFLPYATVAIPTYRVVCSDSSGGVVFEAVGLALPDAPVSVSGSAASFAFPLLTEATDGGSLSITLTAASFAGLLSVNASAANVTVLLPAYSSLVAGQSMTVRQTGTGAAVIVRPASGDPTVEGFAAWPIATQFEAATISRGFSRFSLISPLMFAATHIVVERSGSIPSVPLAGRIYLATSAVGSVWVANGLYMADGLGGWIALARRAGMLAIVLSETTQGSPRPYCWSGTAWVAWSPVAAAAETFVAQHQVASGTAGGIPVTNIWTRTDMNTVIESGISGASLSGGGIALPAGTYDIDAVRVLGAVNGASVRVLDPVSGLSVRSPNVYLRGERSVLDFDSDGGTPSNPVIPGSVDAQDYVLNIRVHSIVRASGPITLTTASVLELQYFASVPYGDALNTDLGWPLSIAATPEIYAQVSVRKR